MSRAPSSRRSRARSRWGSPRSSCRSAVAGVVGAPRADRPDRGTTVHGVPNVAREPEPGRDGVEERAGPLRQDGVQVGHDRDRDGEAPVARRAHERERVGRRDVGGERPPEASWITGPSITGSENGMPTSIASAPARLEPPQERRVDAGQTAGHVRDERRARRASRARRAAPVSSAATDGVPSRRPHRVEVLVAAARQADQRPRAPRAAARPQAASRSRAPARARAGCPRSGRARWNPASASSSVALTCTRRGRCPAGSACSGPTPG